MKYNKYILHLAMIFHIKKSYNTIVLAYNARFITTV